MKNGHFALLSSLAVHLRLTKSS